MFGRKGPHGDIKKSLQKVADPKKDTATRLKHLRIVLESPDTHDAKPFFEANYSHIYFIFNEVFGNVEAELKQRANKAHREELEMVLHIFEKILLLLPELIHKKWMFNSIGRTMKKLLHPGNSLKLRREGMRLFLIWYQILQDNTSEECDEIYLRLVPGLGEGAHSDVLNMKLRYPAQDSYGGIIAAGELTPILPSAGEKLPENITKFFFDNLLQFMVTEVVKVEWMNSEMRETSFVFLFNKFKSSYLKWLLPDFDEQRTIYNPVSDPLPNKRTAHDMTQKDEPYNASDCRDSFINWLANFTIISRKKDTSLIKGISCSALTDQTASAEDQKETLEPSVDSSDLLTCTNTSAVGSPLLEKDSTNSSICSGEEHTQSEFDIVRTVLYSTRENVNLVHESFRQALLFSFRHADAIKRVIAVYKDWFQHAEELPLFMQEPLETNHVPEQNDIPDFLHNLPDIKEEEGSSDDSPTPTSTPRQLLDRLIYDISDKSHIRNASYLGAITELADSGESHQAADVRAGLQKVLQVFITNAANIFLLQTEDDLMLKEQVDLCRRVLNIYRHIVINIPMDQKTWEQILSVLLCITVGVLKQDPPAERQHSLEGRLAHAIFQTLIVTWIKANLNVYISPALWDEFLEVLSSLKQWIELIKEWAKTMDTLTKMLARQVYNLDLTDLPLQRLSEQKEKKKRGKTQVPSKQEIVGTFSRAWNRNEGAPTQRMSMGAIPSEAAHFERGRFKSEGAGGSRNRPDLAKQRSLSGEPSPAHSRSASNTSDIIIRCSSEGDIADPADLAGRLKAVADAEESAVPMMTPSAAESASLASTESAMLGYSIMDQIADNLEKSDSETIVRYSRTPSPGLVRSRSPSPINELVETTPDRDSLLIDVLGETDDNTLTKDNFDLLGSYEDCRSILAGGTRPGWTPDVAVVLWKRTLGSLGNINEIEDPDIHAVVFEYLCALLEILLKIRENLSVTHDNQSSPPPPELLPPQFIFAPWLFQCLTLSDKYKRGKLLAYQLLCRMVVSAHDLKSSPELLSQFYKALHNGLVSTDQEIMNVLVEYCGPQYFSCPLPGSSLLMLDFIHAAGTVASSRDIYGFPRAEAVALLGSLVCFPNHFGEIPVLQPSTVERTWITCDECKDSIINLLLNAGKREPINLARCISISSIGIFLYEELSHGTLHPKLKEGINVLLAALKICPTSVAKVASDILMMLCDHVQKLLSYHPDLPKKIVEVICSTISTMVPNLDSSSSDQDKWLVVSMMFCILEWTIKIPLNQLLETSDSEKSCIYKVYRVLNSVVTGHTSDSLLRSSLSIPDFSQDNDFDTVKDTSASSAKSAVDGPSEALPESPKHSPEFEPPRKTETNIVKLAARMLMTHLVNYLAHFPMGCGAARLNSSVQEHHDLPNFSEDDLTPEIFNAPNVQTFVLNHRSLVSFIELPALLDVPGGGVTAGLTTAQTVCRLIVRDLSGKFCWESAMLYGPPWCQKGSFYQADAKKLFKLSTDVELEPLLIQEDSTMQTYEPVTKRDPSKLQLHDSRDNTHESLNDLLQYIGHISPECLLIPGVALNIPAEIPKDLSPQSEYLMTDMVLEQKEAEFVYFSRHKADASMVARPQMPADVEEPVSPFQMCRMMLDQMGLLSWDKRCHFDLLKKSDKLLRELKNLDNQKCRDTHKFAVIYVAEGQEDKYSILSNTGGSKGYEDFVAGLGWEVDLETHQGFLGGLQQNKTTGDTAPYYANSTCEVIFHVSTRLPSGNDDARHKKMRHLGNDEVHIVWSEHTRDYRRGIIPTDFGDVMIIIYPIQNGLYRIHIDRKPDIPYFGPLFNGAIVDQKILPGLVRATAINASRLKRSLLPYYHSYYEERAKCLETIIQQHTEQTTFEDFAAKVFAPVLPSLSINVDQQESSESSGIIPEPSHSTEQLSPAPTMRQSRASSSWMYETSSGSEPNILVKTAKRLSMKSRKTSATRVSSSTPPESPNMKVKK